MNRLSIFMFEDGISFKPKNTFLKLDSQRPTIYQINGNFMTILMDLSDLRFYFYFLGEKPVLPRPLFMEIPLYHGE